MTGPIRRQPFSTRILTKEIEMERLKLRVVSESGKLFLVGDVDTILNGRKTYKIEKKDDNEDYFSSTTCTTNMREFIGNVVFIDGEKCSVKGVYNGVMQEVKNIHIIDKKVNQIGQRVMVSEHLTVNGRMELVATSKPMLENGINFVNIGWKNKELRQIRIDIYTGESREM